MAKYNWSLLVSYNKQGNDKNNELTTAWCWAREEKKGSILFSLQWCKQKTTSLSWSHIVQKGRRQRKRKGKKKKRNDVEPERSKKEEGRRQREEDDALRTTTRFKEIKKKHAHRQTQHSTTQQHKKTNERQKIRTRKQHSRPYLHRPSRLAHPPAVTT